MHTHAQKQTCTDARNAKARTQHTRTTKYTHRSDAPVGGASEDLLPEITAALIHAPRPKGQETAIFADNLANHEIIHENLATNLGGVGPDRGLRGEEQGAEGGGVRSGSGAARTILLFHIIISTRPSKQPLMVRAFLKVYMVRTFLKVYLFLGTSNHTRSRSQLRLSCPRQPCVTLVRIPSADTRIIRSSEQL